MFDVSKTAENRLDIQISGSLDSAAMRQLLNELETAASDFSNGKMLYTISHFTMPTLGAMAVEFGHLPKLFGLIGKFDKCAVIADASACLSRLMTPTKSRKPKHGWQRTLR